MANNTHTGIAAKALLQGDKPAALLVGLQERFKWVDKRPTDTVESIELTVASPATRFKNIPVTVPPTGCQLGMTDNDIETFFQTNGTYPSIRFEGLSVEFWTSKESNKVSMSGKASKAYLCDEAGNVKK